MPLLTRHPFLKKLEHKLRDLRPYVMPSFRKAYAELLKRNMHQHRPGEPIVCLDLADQAIDAVGGRYYCSLVRDVIDAGYFPVFVSWRGTFATFGTSRFKSRLLEERFGVVPCFCELHEPFVLITDLDDEPPPLASKVIRMDYTRRLCRSPEDVAFPVFVHPRLAPQLKTIALGDLDAKRPVRLFFGGRTSKGAYDKDLMEKVYKVLSRRRMLDIACSRVDASEIVKPDDAGAWLDGNEKQRLVIFETQHQMIPRDRWLEALRKVDFFLACPGVDMPACHNLVESLAMGAIPILQYSQYMTPSLQHGVNCLSFHDEESLRRVVDEALHMSPQRIRELRRNARKHYEDFFAQGKFAQRLLQGPEPTRTLLLNEYRVPR